MNVRAVSRGIDRARTTELVAECGRRASEAKGEKRWYWLDRRQKYVAALQLRLDRLADDEVDALAGIVAAVLRHEKPVLIGKQQLDRIERLCRKLTLERERRGLPRWEGP